MRMVRGEPWKVLVVVLQMGFRADVSKQRNALGGGLVAS
jgi:hypothetical protein